MKPSSIVAIILRLFAIYWVATAAIYLIGSVSTVGLIDDTRYLITLFALPTMVYLVLAWLAWMFAARISRACTGRHDAEISLVEIRPEHLYTVGMLCLGLYFCLGHLAGLASVVMHTVINRAGETPIRLQTGPSPLDGFMNHAVPCVAGAVISVFAPGLGRRLARVHPPQGTD